jgi:flotillin
MEFSFIPYIIGVVGLLVVVGLAILVMVILRRVVSTNEVHIVQSSAKTISYGKDMADGNTYYAWPSWVPKLGVVVIKLPVSVFSGELNSYEAYDSGRLPFVVDIKAFFRIDNSNLAAQRVSSFDELSEQLQAILQGAVRTILAAKDIEQILSGRSEFGEAFTAAVNEQLKNWGVTTVKMIELMDIRDSKESRVIANIMEKKKSQIEKESRVEVAGNKKLAQIAEIEAQREVELSKQEAEQQVGIRTAQVAQEVGIAREKTAQTVQEQAAITAAKNADVQRVEEVKTAEIQRDKAIVKAEESARTTVLVAEGDLQATKLAAEGVTAQGVAKAAAEKAMQLAPVEAQIVLAKEIGENQGYQTYLVTLEQVKAGQVIGVAQAEALKAADIKVIANGGSVDGGIKTIGGLFTSAGGTQLGAMLEGLAQTDEGKRLLALLPKP